MLQSLREFLAGQEPKAARESFRSGAALVVNLEQSIEDYITKLFSSGILTEQQSEQSAGILFLASHIGRIADRCRDISKINDEISESGKSLSEEAKEELGACISASQKVFDSAMEAMLQGNAWEVASRMAKDKRRMRKAQKQFNKAHLARVKKNICDASLTNSYSGILNNLDRISDNCFGIVEESLENPDLLVKREELMGSEH